MPIDFEAEAQHLRGLLQQERAAGAETWRQLNDLAATLRHVRQSIHQAHHQDSDREPPDCPIGVCREISLALNEVPRGG